MVDFYEYSTPELVRLLGIRFKEVIGQINTIDYVLPELPESPYLMRKDDKKVQRIRHSK